jgi:hypothetical protein
VIVNNWYADNDPAVDQTVTRRAAGQRDDLGRRPHHRRDVRRSVRGREWTEDDFGFNVKYNKNMTSLQGSLNVIVRAGAGRFYQIKTNATNSLRRSSSPAPPACRASSARRPSRTSPTRSSPVSLGGNLDLQVTMRDNGEPGTNDTIGITLRASNGALLVLEPVGRHEDPRAGG